MFSWTKDTVRLETSKSFRNIVIKYSGVILEGRAITPKKHQTPLFFYFQERWENKHERILNLLFQNSELGEYKQYQFTDPLLNNLKNFNIIVDKVGETQYFGITAIQENQGLQHINFLLKLNGIGELELSQKLKVVDIPYRLNDIDYVNFDGFSLAVLAFKDSRSVQYILSSFSFEKDFSLQYTVLSTGWHQTFVLIEGNHEYLAIDKTQKLICKKLKSIHPTNEDDDDESEKHESFEDQERDFSLLNKSPRIGCFLATGGSYSFYAVISLRDLYTIKMEVSKN